MYTQEKEFLEWLKNGCIYHNTYFRKIPDLPQGNQSKKPFDAIMIKNGIAILIEAKREIVLGEASPKLYYVKFRPSQWEELLDEVKHGIVALTMPNFCFVNRGSRKAARTESYLLPFANVTHYKETFRGSKGVPLDYISKNGFRLVTETVKIKNNSKKILWFEQEHIFNDWINT